MTDITKIIASLATPGLANALQGTEALVTGETIEARIAQIMADGVLKLISSVGNFELKASHPSLQVGMPVRVTVSQSGAVTLSLSPRAAAPDQVPHNALGQNQKDAPAVIANLSDAARQSFSVNYSAPAALQTSPTPHSIALRPPVQPAPQETQEAVMPVFSAPPQKTGLSPPAGMPLQSANSPNLSPGADNPVSNTILLAAESPPPSVSTQSTKASAAPLVTASPGVAAMLHDAVSKQTSLAPLLANLDYVAKRSSAELPPPLRAAIEQVLNTLHPASALSVHVLEQALKRSGIFFENGLLRAHHDTALPGQNLQFDLKNALLRLQTVLSGFEPAGKTTLNPKTAVLPLPGGDAPQIQSREVSLFTQQTALTEIISVLTQQTESALSRLRVLQFASMPLPTGIEPSSQQTRPAQILHIDLPLALPGQILVIPLQIEREAAKRDAEKRERRWRVRFAFELEGLGAIHALLALTGGLVNITLWAENNETYQLFKSFARELHYALMDDEVDVAEIEFRAGSPRGTVPPSGSYLNTQT